MKNGFFFSNSWYFRSTISDAKSQFFNQKNFTDSLNVGIFETAK